MLKTLGADLEVIVTMTGAILLAAEVGGPQRLSEAIDALRRRAESCADASTKAAMLTRICEALRRTYRLPQAADAGAERASG
jgi:hypothetical protein